MKETLSICINAQTIVREVVDMTSDENANLDTCPKCGGAMRLEDKSTFTGRDMRTYVCDACNEWQVVDNGVALWQVLSDAREEERRRTAKRSISRRVMDTFHRLMKGKRSGD